MNILNPKREIILQGTFEGDIYEFDGVIADESKKTDIEIAVGKRLQGVSLESISDFRYGYILAVQTLNYVVTSFPEKFSKLRSFEEIDDHEFILELITDYRTKEAEFRGALKKITLKGALKNTEMILDLFLMKELRIFPRGISNLQNLFPEQKLFLLEALTSLDFRVFGKILVLQREKEELEKKKPSEFIEEISPNLTSILEKEGFTLEYIETLAINKKKEALEKLDKKIESL